MLSLSPVLALVGLLPDLVDAGNITNSILHLPASKPQTAVRLTSALASFSIEGDRWPDWAGNLTHPNNYTYALLDNLKSRTGQAPSVRIGGHSEDSFIYSPSLEISANVFPTVYSNSTGKDAFPEATYTAVGRDFYLLSGNLPAGTAFTWGANLKVSNTSEVVAQVKAIKEAFADSRLASQYLDLIEIGNEPDGFPGSGRPANYSPFDYVKEYAASVSAVTAQLDEHDVRYQIGALVAGLISWKAADILNTGVMTTDLGMRIASMSEHHYQNPRGYNLYVPGDLPTKPGVRGNLTRYGVSADLSHQYGLKYYLGETNTNNNHGIGNLSNTAAAALWMIDYSLQAATLNIDGVYYHNGLGYNYSVFQPIDGLGATILDYDPSAKRHILPLYNGFVAVADAIGNSGKSCISELWTDTSFLAAYAIWEKSVLSRVVVINSRPWYSSNSTADRPAYAIQLPDLAGKLSNVKRLEFAGLDSLSGVTWGGQSWETYSGYPDGSVKLDSLSANGTFLVNASSAVLIYV